MFGGQQEVNLDDFAAPAADVGVAACPESPILGQVDREEIEPINTLPKPQGFRPVAPGKAPAPALPTVDEAMQRRKVVEKIRRYETAFPETVRPITEGKKLDDETTWPLARCENLLAEIRVAVGTKHSGNVNIWLAKVVLYALEEGLIQFTPVLARGPAGNLTNLLQDPAYVDTLKEISLEWGDIYYCRPEYRLVLMTLQYALAIDGANRTCLRTAAMKPANTAAMNAAKELEELRKEIQ